MLEVRKQDRTEWEVSDVQSTPETPCSEVVMRNKLLAVVLAFTLMGCTTIWNLYSHDNTLVVKLDGSIDIETVDKVTAAIQTARDQDFDRLLVIIRSPGGLVIPSMEAARLLREASDSGLIVATHGQAIVASGALIVLAAGTPGYRSIDGEAFVLIHGIQAGGGFMTPPSCVNPKFPAESEDDKALNAIHNLLASALARYTGLPYMAAVELLTCEKEQAGGGIVAVQNKIADRVTGHPVIPVTLPQFVRPSGSTPVPEKKTDLWRQAQ